MILIDFDKLMEAYNDFYDEFAVHDLRYLKKECLPTVEAIPVEWIKKYAKRFIELENRNYFAYRGFSDIGEAILHMLEEWEKENDKDSE